MTMKLLDNTREAKSILTSLSQELAFLADSFHAVGNDKVAKKLYNFCGDLTEVSRLITEGNADVLNENLKNARASAASALAIGFMVSDLQSQVKKGKRG